ncbi:glycosyltransferase [Singulisphaera sp. Ch08]|uniref:Glycosyltransferase n=1 Tax=Singulisphaera sp. Ch08 TaxID=3120278 RepID=A0AAU7CPW1_9BACT
MFVLLGEKNLPVGELQASGFPVQVIEQRPGSSWRCSRRLVRVFERERVDLVHVHQATSWLFGAMARLHYRRPPILLTEHERGYPDFPPLKRVAAIRVLLERRDRIVAVSHTVRRSLILNEGLPPERVAVIYHGIAPLPAAAAHVGDSVRQEIGVGSDMYLILQVARLDLSQNHAIALRALEQVVRSVPRTRLALVGEGPEQGIVRELVRRHGLESHVLFLGLRTDYHRLMAAADVVLLTSLSEDLPLALVYALAAGRPVVAIRAGSVGEVVVNRRSGLLACPNDDDSLTENLLLLCKQPDLRARLGREALERAERMFSEAAMAQSYHAMYREMLGQGHDESGPETAIMVRR